MTFLSRKIFSIFQTTLVIYVAFGSTFLLMASRLFKSQQETCHFKSGTYRVTKALQDKHQVVSVPAMEGSFHVFLTLILYEVIGGLP
jgi:hypothetical protein